MATIFAIFAAFCLLAASATGDEPGNSLDFPILGDYISIRGKGGHDSANLTQFINDHYIRLRLPFSAESHEVSLREILSEEDEGRKKPGGFIVPLLLALKLKLVLALLAVVGLVAIKGLLAGVFALMLSKMQTFRSVLDRRDGDDDRCGDSHDRDIGTAIVYYPRRRMPYPHRVVEYTPSGYNGEVWDEWDKNLRLDG